MFTGIVTQIGTLDEVRQRDKGKVFRVRSGFDYSTLDIGASVAHAGICLTVTATGDGWHEVEAWEEALRVTVLGGWNSGQRMNLERSLRIGDELGGHMVSGHVDGIATIVETRQEGEATRFVIEAPENLARFIAPKGSVALDGTSLTVNGVDGNRFDVLLIAHTLEVTTWGDRKAGDSLNIEIDQMARYAARLMEYR